MAQPFHNKFAAPHFLNTAAPPSETRHLPQHERDTSENQRTASPIFPGITSPERRQRIPALRGRLDLDVDTSRQRELVECINRLTGRLDNIYDPLMSPNFELLARLLIDVRTPQNSVPLNTRRQWNRPVNDRAGPLGGVDNVGRRLIEDGVVKGLHPDADTFAGSHGSISFALTLDAPRCYAFLFRRLERGNVGYYRRSEGLSTNRVYGFP